MSRSNRATAHRMTPPGEVRSAVRVDPKVHAEKVMEALSDSGVNTFSKLEAWKRYSRSHGLWPYVAMAVEETEERLQNGAWTDGELTVNVVGGVVDGYPYITVQALSEEGFVLDNSHKE